MQEVHQAMQVGVPPMAIPVPMTKTLVAAVAAMAAVAVWAVGHGAVMHLLAVSAVLPFPLR
jgi:hypothetical protein